MIEINRKAILLIIGFIFLSGLNAFAQTAKYDFDGDGKSDPSIYRPLAGEWWHYRSSDNGNGAVKFGKRTDYPFPADYTGDGITDVAFIRTASYQWYILRSEDNTYYSFQFGVNGDIPKYGDFDGDGKADPTVFRPSTGTWFTIRSSTSEVSIKQFGTSNDFATVEDFDGDGKDDFAVYRYETGDWWIDQSQDGVVVYHFGSTPAPPFTGVVGEIYPIPADFTGDGKADVAFYHPQSGVWYILRSENPTSYYSFPFGTNGDLPVVGDYDGDGKADAAVWRPDDNIWYLQQSTDGFKAILFGTEGDYPLAAIPLVD